MVLGGSGQIGAPLCEFLRSQGHKVYNVDLVNGEEYDLRKLNSTVSYWMSQVDFVYFLAFDIGGSKFLKTKQDDFAFLMNNTAIMANVFKMLEEHKKPFVFASSSMAGMSWSPYGNLKKVGEHFTESLGAVSVRFWNIYGPEHDEMRAHVITDFIKKAKNTRVIDMMTDGSEVRQFLHAKDCSKILLTIAEQYEEVRKHKKLDVSNGVWSSVNEVAEIVAKYYDARIIRSPSKDTVQNDSRIEPNLDTLRKFWNPEDSILLKDGILDMIKYYEGNNG